MLYLNLYIYIYIYIYIYKDILLFELIDATQRVLYYVDFSPHTWHSLVKNKIKELQQILFNCVPVWIQLVKDKSSSPTLKVEKYITDKLKVYSNYMLHFDSRIDVRILQLPNLYFVVESVKSQVTSRTKDLHSFTQVTTFWNKPN